jgi:hypothetical protein
LQLGTGITATVLTVKSDASHNGLVVTDGIAGDSITLDNMLTGIDSGVTAVRFSDGSSLSASQIIQMETTGTSGADRLYGSASADLFDGKGGNDFESGNGGNDTFVFDQGYGALEVFETSIGQSPDSILQFGVGISENSLRVTASSSQDSLVISDGISGDAITIDNMLGGQYYGVNAVQFADGTMLTSAQLIAMETTGTSGNDILVGSEAADLFDGKGGSDYESGNGGNDTFVFNEGYGSLEINEMSSGPSPNSILQFGASIGANSLRVTASSDRGSLVVTDGISGDVVTIDNMLGAQYHGVNTVEFADGTTMTSAQLVAMEMTGTIGDDTIIGTTGAELLDGKGGSDYENGEGGNDTFVFDAGYGSLSIDEANYTSSADSVLQFGAGITETSIHVSASGDNLIVTDGVSGDVITLNSMLDSSDYGIDTVEFADGSTINSQTLVNLAHEISGSTGADRLTGTSGGDYFDGDGGGDYENGNSGSDTFVFNKGYGALEISESYNRGDMPVLILGTGISAADLTVTVDASHNGLVITDGTAGDGISIDGMLSGYDYGVTQVEFADGSSLSSSELIQMETTGASSVNRLYGSAGADLFDGKGGGDYESGDGGNDTFVFDKGYGALEINESYNRGDQPVLLFGPGVTAADLTVTSDASHNGLIITDGTSGDSISIDGMLSGYEYGVTQIEFADGSSLSSSQIIQMETTGTSSANGLYGTAGGDVFDGVGGGDYENGNGGSDTFVFDKGYGALEINESYSRGDQPVLQLGVGIAVADLTVTSDASHNGLVIDDGTAGDSISLDNMLAGIDNGVTTVEFADGSSLSSSQLVQIETTGTSSANSMYGTSGADVFDGEGGSDFESGNGGNDTFVFNGGYGALDIFESSIGPSPDSVLQLGAGISVSTIRVAASRDQNSLVITDSVSGDAITIDYMLVAQYYGVNTVQFADGSSWTRADLIALENDANANSDGVFGTSASDNLFGSPNADYFDGSGGGDFEAGGGGNDTFVYNEGYGSLEIYEAEQSGDASILKLGSGITSDTLSVSLSADGSSIVLTDGVAGDQILIDNMGSATNWGVSAVQFVDGTSLTTQQLITMAGASPADGNQIVYDGTSADGDALIGSSRSEILDGKGGNDYLVGNGGNDTFVFDKGYDYNEIAEHYGDGDTPVLQLGGGILEANLKASLDDSGTGILLTDVSDGDEIRLDNEVAYANWGVTQVQFADGTSLSAQQLITLANESSADGAVTEYDGTPADGDALIGTGSAEIFDGKGGNDYLVGGGGSDTFVFNKGYDYNEIAESYSDGQTPVLKLGAGMLEANLRASVTDDGTSILLTDISDGDEIRLDNEAIYSDWGVTEIQFADGTTMDQNSLIALTHETGDAGANLLWGNAEANVFDGQGGNDLEEGEGGSDTFVYKQEYGKLEIYEAQQPGDASVLQMGIGITSSDILVSSSADGSSIILTDGVAGDQITIDNMGSATNWGVSGIQFADGTSLTSQQLVTMASASPVDGDVIVYNGTPADGDALIGSSRSEIFDGKGGNDYLVGNGGNDTFVFDKGYDYNEIAEQYADGDTPVLRLGAGITEANLKVSLDDSGSGLLLTDVSDGDEIRLDNEVAYSNWGVTQVQFADGSTLGRDALIAEANGIYGTAQDDQLAGTSADEYFDGKGGTDVEIGGGGNDTYAMQSGYGALTIENGTASSEVANGALSILGEDPSNIWFRQVGNDLEVDVLGTSTKATVQGWFSQDSSKLAAITVAGGDSGDVTIDSQLNQLIQAMATYSVTNPGFDPTNASQSEITDPSLLAQVTSDWHKTSA